MTIDDLVDAKIMLRELDRALVALDGKDLVATKDGKEVMRYGVCGGVWRLDLLLDFLEAVRCAK